MDTNLSIIIPVFNEEENIPLIIKEFEKHTDNYSFEVIFAADQGSSEPTKKLIEKISKEHDFVNYIIAPDRGYGASIYAGLKSAKGKFIGWTHADLQTNPQDALKALTIIKQQSNPELTYLKGKRHGRPFFDKFFEFGMSIFESIILRTYLIDINAQPNIFHHSFLDLMQNPPEDFSFDLYTYYLAKSNNYQIKKFPVIFPERIHGESAWNTSFQEKLKFIKRTLDFSFKLKKTLA
jgi:glycosyltransferase involved in cell wall biosynthesis